MIEARKDSRPVTQNPSSDRKTVWFEGSWSVYGSLALVNGVRSASKVTQANAQSRVTAFTKRISARFAGEDSGGRTMSDTTCSHV